MVLMPKNCLEVGTLCCGLGGFGEDSADDEID